MDLKTIYMKKRYEAPAAVLIYLIVVPEERWSCKEKNHSEKKKNHSEN